MIYYNIIEFNIWCCVFRLDINYAMHVSLLDVNYYFLQSFIIFIDSIDYLNSSKHINRSFKIRKVHIIITEENENVKCNGNKTKQYK